MNHYESMQPPLQTNQEAFKLGFGAGLFTGFALTMCAAILLCIYWQARSVDEMETRASYRYLSQQQQQMERN